jgi:hypothetical protein
MLLDLLKEAMTLLQRGRALSQTGQAVFQKTRYHCASLCLLCHSKVSALPLRPLRLCGEDWGAQILQPQRRRGRKGSAEESKSA